LSDDDRCGAESKGERWEESVDLRWEVHVGNCGKDDHLDEGTDDNKDGISVDGRPEDGDTQEQLDDHGDEDNLLEGGPLGISLACVDDDDGRGDQGSCSEDGRKDKDPEGADGVEVLNEGASGPLLVVGDSGEDGNSGEEGRAGLVRVQAGSVEEIAALVVAALLVLSRADDTIAADLVGEIHAAASAEGLVLSCGLTSGEVEEGGAPELVGGDTGGDVGDSLSAAESEPNGLGAVLVG